MAQPSVSIDDAAQLTGVSIHTLRYWEAEFFPHLQPERTDGCHRRYSPEDIETIFAIKRLLRDELLTIAGARRFLDRRAEALARYP